MYNELVERLRNKGCQICPICREAADAIEELSITAENMNIAGRLIAQKPQKYVRERASLSQKQTHGDLIRASTDEKLAEMHVGVGCPPGTELNELCFGENGEELLCTPSRCRECWLEWLRQEAHDES